MAEKEIIARGKCGMLYARKKYRGHYIQDRLGYDPDVAREYLRQIKADIRAGRRKKTSNAYEAFEKGVIRYREKILPTKSSATRERNEGILSKHLTPFFGEHRMADLLKLMDSQDHDFIPWIVRYKQFREKNKARQSTLKKEFKVLKDILWLADQSFQFPNSRTNPFMLCEHKGKEITEAPDLDDVLAIGGKLNPLYRRVWLVGCFSGLRLSNIVNLMLENFKRPGWLKGKQFKTGLPYSVPITKPLLAVLNSIAHAPNAGEKLLPFKTDMRKRIFPEVKSEAVTQALIRTCRALGYRDGDEKLNFKTSRHFFASLLANSGVREDVIAYVLGHKGKGVTQIYIHHREEMIQREVNQGLSQWMKRCPTGVQRIREVINGGKDIERLASPAGFEPASPA